MRYDLKKLLCLLLALAICAGLLPTVSFAAETSKTETFTGFNAGDALINQMSFASIVEGVTTTKPVNGLFGKDSSDTAVALTSESDNGALSGGDIMPYIQYNTNTSDAPGLFA